MMPNIPQLGSDMLLTRITTAIVLVILFLLALFVASPEFFCLSVAVVILMAGWEWASLSELNAFCSKLFYVCLLALVLAILGDYSGFIFGNSALTIDAVFLFRFFLSAALFWLLAFLALISYPRCEIIFRNRYFRLIMGMLLLIFAWLALSYLRYQSHGSFWVLYVVAVVAAADVGAYFFGKTFGKTKLAHQVSPGKSWEGLAGGLLSSLLLVAITVGFNTAFFSLELPSLTLLLPVTLLIAAVSVLGDLFESLLKRIAGLKDSGTILPGHGGVLDRIDGLTSALPIFCFIFLLFGW